MSNFLENPACVAFSPMRLAEPVCAVGTVSSLSLSTFMNSTPSLINRVEVFALTVLLTMMLFGVYFSRTNLPYFNEVYTVEDGVVESLSVVALVIACGVCVYRVFALRSVRSRWFLICTGILGALFFFGAGEEISWGQRIFNVESPEFFKSNNAQQETNLHNLVVGEVKINRLVFGKILAVIVVSYVLILPVLYRKVGAIRNWVDGWAIPLPRWIHVVAYLLIASLATFIPSSRKGELLELGGCIIFLLVTLYPHNRSAFASGRS